MEPAEDEQPKPQTGRRQDGPTFHAEEDTSRILVRASRSEIESIRKLLTQIDQPRPQPLIRAPVVEVSLDGGFKFGFEGFWQDRRWKEGRIQFSGNPATGFRWTGDGGDFTTTLRALAEGGRAKVLATPSILLIDNQVASISIGQQVPIPVASNIKPQGGTVTPVQYVDVGVILCVAAHIGGDGVVTLVTRPEISSLGSEAEEIEKSPGVRVRMINKSFAETAVAVRQGQSVVLGGLIREIERLLA